jgi:hypothetical protein
MFTTYHNTAKLPYDKCPSALMGSVLHPREAFPEVRPEILTEGQLIDIAIHAAKRRSQHLPATWQDTSLGPRVAEMTSLSD